MRTPAWRGTQRVLLHGGVIHSTASPFATAMLVDGDRIAWLGDDSAVATHGETADAVVDLRGALVTPGFVDSHVHATSAGLALLGIDLSACTSRVDALDAIAHQQSGGVVIGHGWDETTWADARSFTRQELDQATNGAAGYFSRVDVHSAAVTTALLEQIEGIRGLEGYDDSGHLTRAAHHAAREWALSQVARDRRADAQQAVRAQAVSLGIVSLHEMAGPVISSESDLAQLQSITSLEPGPLLAAYWGEHADLGGVARALEFGAVGAGGDLFIDGSVGSHTACLREPYLDAPDQRGAQYLDSSAVARHLQACGEAGIQGGFHVIGDRATDVIVDALEQLAAALGDDVVQQAHHRLEHAEMLDDRHLQVLGRLGVTLSMQPMFDALWGRSAGMYERRLGADRAQRMNRFATAQASGILLAFGSDAPVTQLGPWAAMRAAMFHNQPHERVTARAAFSAHTRAGWRSVGDMESGVLAPEAPAHYVVWDCQDLVVQAPDARTANWSTDPRSGTPGLPDLHPDLPLPRALRTVVAGRTVYDSSELT